MLGKILAGVTGNHREILLSNSSTDDVTNLKEHSKQNYIVSRTIDINYYP